MKRATKRFHSPGIIGLLFACVSGVTPVLAATSGNLLVGADAEAGQCTTDWKAVTTVPGWTVAQGSPAVVCYSIASFATPARGASSTNWKRSLPFPTPICSKGLAGSRRWKRKLAAT